jgi:hypothetical protein
VIRFDDVARDAVELAVPDVAAIAELGREDLQKRVATRGGQRFRQPEKLVELRVGKGEGLGRPPIGHGPGPQPINA